MTNKYAARFLLCLCVICLCLSGYGWAADDSTAPKDPNTDIVFIPPASGAPADRLGAGTRDVATAGSAVTLIVPPQGGLSAANQPLLVWHFAEAVEGPLRISITPVGGLARGFVFSLEGRFAPGFHALNLGRSQLGLSPGQLYRWQVNWSEASSTPTGLIEHRPVEAPFASAVDAAAAGYWYDTIGFLFDLGFSGKVRLNTPDTLLSVSSGAGLDLTNIVPKRE